MLEKYRAWYRALVSKHAAEAGEEGFTLIELMVVVLIIAILMAIAIPTFLGTQKSAQDSQAQQNLQNSLTDAMAAYAQTQDFTLVNSTTIQSAEQNLTVVGAATNTTGNVVSVVTGASTDTGNPGYIELQASSADGKCWMIFTENNAKTWYGEDPAKTCGAAGATTAITALPSANATCSSPPLWETKWPSC